MSTRRATIADVARLAGVSPSTASVVFSGRTRVSAATLHRVREAAATLGYTGPDPRAASLRRGRSGIVGVVFDGALGSVFLDPVTTQMMEGLTEAVAPVGAGLLLLRDTGGATDSGAAHGLMTAPLDAAVLLGCTSALRASLPIVTARGIPVVVIEGDAGAGIPQITLDNRESQRQVASHLRGLGHTGVSIVTLPCDSAHRSGWIAADAEIEVEVTRDRLSGVRDIFADAPAYAASASSIDEGIAAGRVLLTDPEIRPTAVIAQSDLLAAGVVRAAEEAGLRVPQDLSVTGFDGITVDGLAPYRLTTVVQPAVDKGRAAGRAVTAMLEGRPAPTIAFTCLFREGSTSGPPPR